MVVKGDEHRNIAHLALYSKDTSLNYFNLIKNKKSFKISKKINLELYAIAKTPKYVNIGMQRARKKRHSW